MLSARTGSYCLDLNPGSSVKMTGFKSKNGEENVRVLEDEFSLYPSRGSTAVQVKLTKKSLIYDKVGVPVDSREAQLDLWDVAGVTCGRPKGRNGFITEINTASKTKSDIGAYMCLYYYPYSKPPEEGGIRQRSEVIFRYCKEETYEKNLAIVQKWRIAIELLMKNVEVNSVTDIHASRLPAQRKLLVFINPASGRGKGVQIFNKDVAPILKDAGIKVEIIVTKRQNHAREKVKEMDLKDCGDGIVIVSGDGLVYEVLNGLMERPDKKTALEIPIGVVPAGSGNAMSSAILCRLGEGYNKNAIQHAAFILTKAGSNPLDLVVVETQNMKTVSFLAVAWGIIADIDIESERYRFLGAARFTFGALVRIVNLRHYRGKLSYLPLEDSCKYNHKVSRSANQTIDNGRIHEDDGRIHDDDNLQREHMTRHHSTYEMRAEEEEAALTSNGGPRSMPRHLSVMEDLSTRGDLSFNDKFIRADIDTNGDSRKGSMEEGNDSGLHLMLSNEESHELSSSGDNTSMDSGSASDCFSTTFLPALSEPVPSNWITLEGDFVGIVITYMSHLSQDVIAWPGREFDEGCVSIQYTKATSTRKSLIDLMEAFTDGTHIDKGLVECIYARAFRIEPISEAGILTVDGERVEYGPIQAELLPNLKANILTPPQRS